MFEIIITEVRVGETSKVELERTERYKQTVDNIELPKVIAAINYVKRVRKPRGEKA